MGVSWRYQIIGSHVKIGEAGGPLERGLLAEILPIGILSRMCDFDTFLSSHFIVL